MKELLSKLTWVDYIAIGAFLWGLYSGFKAGFFQELMKSASYLLTLVLTLYFYKPAAEQLTLRSSLNESTANIAAIVGLLVGFFVALKVLRMLLAKILKTGEGKGQKLFGALMGAARMLVLLSFFFMLIDRTPLTRELRTDVHTRSLTGPTISEAAPMIYQFLGSISPELLIFEETPVKTGK